MGDFFGAIGRGIDAVTKGADDYKVELYISNYTGWRFHLQSVQGAELREGLVGIEILSGWTNCYVATLRSFTGMGKSDIDWINFRIGGYPTNSCWGIRIARSWDGVISARAGWLPNSDNHDEDARMVDFYAPNVTFNMEESDITEGKSWESKSVHVYKITWTFNNDDIGGTWS